MKNIEAILAFVTMLGLVVGGYVICYALVGSDHYITAAILAFVILASIKVRF